MYAQLYNPKTIEKKYSKISITTKQRKVANEWIKKLKNKELEKEKKNYFVFRDVVLRDLLGYPEKKILYEEKNVEFSIQDEHGDTGVCFEAKGTETKDLFARQGYEKKEQKTPVVQTLSNMERFPTSYGVCTNYRNFVLLDIKKGLSKCHRFDFLSIENNDKKLKEFIGIFSYENLIIKKSLEELYNSSVSEEREFTKEFYKLFHETRLMLIKAFQEKERVDMEEALHHAQLFLNRLIFVFFVSDKGDIESRLFTNRILKILEAGKSSESSRLISDNISKLFKDLDNGSDIRGIFGFNGGLFQEKIPPKIYFFDLKDPEFFREVQQHSKLSKKVQLDELSSKIVKKYQGRINPIISNLLIMDSFDFNTEVNVNILGHIFEQSISDLEDLKKEKRSRRRKEGVFYTPEYVTEYICMNTIIPYLSKTNATSIDELIGEYLENIEELESRIRDIKILDLACGSGAFLVKAVEILLEIDKEIQGMKPQTNTQHQLEEWSNEKEITKLIKKNIFGVDLNEESVEITKLSLLLKMASPNKKLSDLSKNIRTGNSIISDKKIDGKAFDWKKEFPDVFKKGGFDIVIGNPPYVRQEMLTDIKPHLQSKYSVFHGVADLYVYFIEKGISVLKEDGFFSFIVSNKFTKSNYGEKLRQYLLKFKLNTFLDFGDLRVFEDASTYPCIINLKKAKEAKYVKACKIDSLDFHVLSDYLKDRLQDVEVDSLRKSSWSFSDTKTNSIFQKLSSNSVSFGKLVNGEFYRGVTTGLNQAFVIDEEKRKALIAEDPKSEEIIFPYLSGKEIKRYGIEWEGNYLVFTRRGINISKYPAIEKHLSTYRKQLEPKKSSKEKIGRKPGDYKWYEIQDTTAYWEIFLSEGIIYPHFNKRSNFAFSKGNFFPNAKGYQVQSKDLWLLAILNSKLINFYLKSICPFVRGEYYEYNSQYIEKTPISLNAKPRKKLEDLTKTILDHQENITKARNMIKDRIKFSFKLEKINEKLEDFHLLQFNEFLKEVHKKSNVKISPKEQDEWQEYFEEKKEKVIKLVNQIKKWDEEIDQIVYDMYNLTDEERATIEEQLKN